MSEWLQNEQDIRDTLVLLDVSDDGCECLAVKDRFSAYLDGALDGKSMQALAAHLHGCLSCSSEFEAWRSVQAVLGELGPAPLPLALQAQLRDTLAGELERGSHLSPVRRLSVLWQHTVAPMCVRLSAGFTAALLLVGSAIWVIGTAAPVQASDEHMADLHPPRFLYSQAPPEPITTDRRFVAVMVDAKIDADGHVYDYVLVAGPDDTTTRARVETNLLGSRFKPATVFGVPVPGHAMITYTAVSVHG